jgi:hypothetical protein
MLQAPPALCGLAAMGCSADAKAAQDFERFLYFFIADATRAGRLTRCLKS